MNLAKQIFIWLMLLVSLCANAMAEDAISVSPNQPRLKLERGVFHYEDSAGDASIESVMALPASAWHLNQKNQINFGYSTSTFWLKINLRNATPTPLDRLLEIEYAVLDFVDIYLVVNGAVKQIDHMGDKRVFYDRPIENRHFLYPMKLPATGQTTLFIKVSSTSSVQVPLTLWNISDYHKAEQSRLLFQGLYFGITLVMVLSSLFVYVAIKEKSYLFYAGFISCVGFFLASLNGLSFQYLWPTATQWNDRSLIFFLNALLFSGALFAISFLSITKKTHAALYQSLNFIACIAGVLMLAALILPYSTLIVPSIVFAVICCIILFIVALLRVYQGDIYGRYFTVAWTAMLSGGIVLAMNKFTVLPYNFITENAMQIGSAMEIILLSLALADRLHYEKQKAFTAQKMALVHEREARAAQEEMINVQKKANLQLENKVKERTAELEKVNAKLLELSSTDPLTGLKNRGYFDDQFRHGYASAYRNKRSLALLIIDIDKFKTFNDNHGHLIGDECLLMVTDCIRQVISRPEDIIARYGGEEFVVILPETEIEGARNVAEKLRQRIEKTPFMVAEDILHIRVSIGVAAEVPTNPDGRTALFDRADEALYRAKNGGRNQVCFASPGI